MKMFFAMLLLASTQVAAAGAIIDAGQLGASRAAIEAELSRAKHVDPAAFATAAKLRGDELKRLAARDVWPVVELIAFNGPSRASASVQVGLLEAAAAAHDARVAPVFEAVLRSEGQPFEVYRAASDALDPQGRVSHLAQVTHVLVAALATHPEAARAKDVIQGLTELKDAAPASDEDVQVRDAAAKAVLRAYVAYTGEVRTEASKALETIAAPHTELLIANEKLNGVAVPELEKLEQQLKPAAEPTSASASAHVPELDSLEHHLNR
jgi:hypothetical protein